MRKSLSVTSLSDQRNACRPCTHSKYETMTPPALQRMSGITNTSSQRWSRTRSASGVVGPLAPSARIRHLSWPAFFSGNHAIDRAGSKNVARQREKLVRVHMIILSKRAQVPLLDHVLLGAFNINPFRIVNRSGVIADSDDFDSALIGKRQSRNRTDVAEPLHNCGAFFRIH